MRKYKLKTITVGNAGEFEVKYFLTIHMTGSFCEYGVEVQVKKLDINGNEFYESECFGRISELRSEVIDILTILQKFTVLPSGLEYALDEILDWGSAKKSLYINFE